MMIEAKLGSGMRLVASALLAGALAACGNNNDRLTDEQASTQNAPAGPADAKPTPSVEAKGSVAQPVEYKAVGTEPGWALTVSRGRMEYLGDYGSVQVTEPVPLAFRSDPGRYASGRLVVTITPGPCSDGMSERVYRQSVRVAADGKAVSGCGGGTVATFGAGTNWRVTAINGRRTGAGPDYYLQLTDNMLSAKFGCNAMGGHYALNGDHLSVASLEQDAKACAGPAGAFEVQGSAVLRSNMRIEQVSGERVRLVSEAGTIELEPAS